jgi:hypothetical protein
MQKDEEIVRSLVKEGLIPDPNHVHKRLITYPGFGYPTGDTTHPTDEADDQGEKDEAEPDIDRQMSPEELDAQRRKEERDAERKARDDARHERLMQHNRAAVDLKQMSVYWLSQMDAFRGPWATEWTNVCNLYESRGSLIVFLEAVLSFFPHPSIRYVKGGWGIIQSERTASFLQTARWMQANESSYPSYASNARGGVIADGTYFLTKISAFKRPVPTLDLLYSYEWQVDAGACDDDIRTNDLTLEIVRLDAWLSYVGRLPEITNSRHNLLVKTPVMVKMIYDDLGNDFISMEETASEGGLQEIQLIAAVLIDFLTLEQLTEAEQLFVIVAGIRTAKVCECIARGQDTTHLTDFFCSDMQAHFI